MIENVRARALFILFVSTFAASSVAQGTGGGTRTHEGGAHRTRVHAKVVPFFRASKTVGYPVLFADKREFIEMGAFNLDLTPAMVTGLKVTAQAIQLEYGFKKGGIGCVYEMPIQPGLDALATFQATLKSGIFKDRQYFKEWSIKAVPDKRLLLAVSGTTPQVRDALIRAIGR